MSKSIMISIKPKWCAKIMNGEKTIEVRKNKALANAIQKLIDENGYADIYVYCSKDEDLGLLIQKRKKEYICDKDFDYNKHFYYLASGYNGKGKVVFKFRCYKIEHFEYDTCSRDISGYWLDNGEVFNAKKTCLTSEELFNYIGDKDGYAIYIKDLKIFDKPKELSEFNRFGVDEWAKKHAGKKIGYLEFWNGVEDFRLTKAPQNFCYIEGDKYYEIN